MISEFENLPIERTPLQNSVRLCRCLSDSVVFLICGLLKEKPRNVADIQRSLGMTRNQVNERLRKMRECGMLKAERDGRWLVFRLNPSFSKVLLAIQDFRPPTSELSELEF